MAIIAKFTRTLPAPTATISGGFVFLLSAGWFTQSDQGAAGSPINGVNAILNGGGDMQIFSDTATTTRLPIEVVTFVTGGSPQAQVWVRASSYTSGDTITIGKDDTQISQPVVTDTYGRNAVWIDRVVEQHFTSSNPTDSTGNNSTSSTGSPVSDGESITFNGSSQYLSIADGSGIDGGSAFTLVADYDPTVSGNQLIFWKRGPTGGYALTHLKDSNEVRLTLFGIADYDISASFFTRTLIHAVIDGSNYELFVNGVSQGSIAISSARNVNTNDLHIGARTSSAGVIDDYSAQTQWNSSFIGYALTDEYIEAESDNQSDPDNFGTSSEWVLVSSGISITPDTVNNSQTISNIELNQNHVFSVDSINTLQSVSVAELTQQNNLSVNGLLSIQNISNVSLSVAGVLTVDDVDSLQEVTEPTLTQANILSVDNIETSQSLSNVLLAVSSALNVQGLTQEQVISNVDLVQQYLLGVDGLSQAQTLSNVTLAVEGVLSVDSILSEQTASNSNLITQVALLVDDITNQQFISVVSFDKGQEIGTVTAAFKESDISVKYGILNITVKFKE